MGTLKKSLIGSGRSPAEYAATLSRNLIDSIQAKERFRDDAEMMATFSGAVEHVIGCYRAGGRLYVAGNGGSAADAQHLAAEFTSKFARDRDPLPAEALTTDSSVLTAIGNDFGYEQVFSRQLAGKIRHHDVFLAITTSGRSGNILKALEQCRLSGVKSIVFTGPDGGLVRTIADYCIRVPGNRTSVIQELHIILAHTLCECVETTFFPHRERETTVAS